MDGTKTILPMEVIKLFLRERYGREVTFINKITSARWLTHHRQKGLPTSIRNTIADAFARLRQHVKAYEIRLRGVHTDEPPNFIERSDQEIGELEIFGRQLICPRPVRKPTMVYSNITCVRADVTKLLRGPPSKKPTKRQPPSDVAVSKLAARYVKDTMAAGQLPTKSGLRRLADTELPGVTRTRLNDAFEQHAKTPPKGRPKKNRQEKIAKK
jgi:hypothetical protein